MTRSAEDIWSATLASMDALHAGFLPPGGFTAEVEAMPQQVQQLLRIAAATGYRLRLDDEQAEIAERMARYPGERLTRHG